MSDYIRREDALKAVDDIVCDADDAERTCDRIIDLPSADVVPVVRCKDCKYWREHKYAKETKRYIPFCGFSAIYTQADDYCSKAERR